jgi:membrane-bound serine protease (ClpP class)
MLKRIWLLVWVLIAFHAPVQAQGEGSLVLLLTADGALTPAMREYLIRGIELAERRQAEALIFQLDTPGGSVDLMTEMVEVIRASRVPVIVYVAPRGAMAGSAGTVITLAGHASAMAPETAIGAASPVGSQGEDLGETLEAKTKNILKATVRSLAERRGAEAVALAEQTIEQAEAVSAKEALEIGLVDFIATDVDHLLRQLDGFVVTTSEGEQILVTQGAEVQPVDPLFIERLLGILTNPTVVFLLLTVGVQSLLIELSSPGGWVAGFLGVICLALAAYGLGVLPVNWFGAVFVIMAFVLFLLDIKAPTHGALTAAGVISLIVGSLVLFNTPEIPSFQRVPVPLIILTSIGSGALFFVVMMFAVRAQLTPVRMGLESLTGRVGVARSDLQPNGLVQLGGEQWSAELAPGEGPLVRGEQVEVVGVQGLKLVVRKPKE